MTKEKRTMRNYGEKFWTISKPRRAAEAVRINLDTAVNQI
jgi:hypothetical protein